MHKSYFTYILTKVLNGRTITVDDIIRTKKTLNIKETLTFVMQMYKNVNITKYYTLFASNYNNILRPRFPSSFTPQFREESITKEINYEMKFLIAEIVAHSKEIIKFAETRRCFENLFMSGKFKETLDVIENFEKEYGFSFWGIDCKMCIYSYYNTKKINGYFNEIINNCNNELVKTYVKVSRYRFSEDVTATYFNALLDEFLKECEENNEDPNFINSFKMFTKTNTDITRIYGLHDIRCLLTISDYVPLIDKYLILEKILGWFCSASIFHENNYKEWIKEYSSILKEKINTSFWKNICCLLGDYKKITINNEKKVINSALELFCKGKIGECYKYCIQQLTYYPSCFSLINLLAKSGNCKNSISPNHKLAKFIRKLYAKEEKDTEFVGVINQCNVYERIFSHFTFGNNLGVIIENETKPIMLQGKISYVNALIYSNFTPSKLVFFLPEQYKNEFISEYGKKIGELYFSDWQISTYSEASKDLSLYMCDQTSFILNKINNSPDNTDDFYNKLNSINTDKVGKNICKSFWLKRQFDISVANSDFPRAIYFYVKAYFESQWMVMKFDINRINRKINRKLKGYLESSLSYCIYAYVTKFEIIKGTTISETVVNSCSKILKQKKISEISIPEESLERKKLVYFLKNICTYDVLRRINYNAQLSNELYYTRIQIIDLILQNFKHLSEETMLVLDKEKNDIKAKIDYLDIARCINKGKINTSWIVLSDEANEAILYVYNMFNGMTDSQNLLAYINAFAMVKKDFVQEINRILSITIRHGILEGELVRFFKRRGINNEKGCINTENKESIDVFYKNLYNLISDLLNNFIFCTYKYESDSKLLIFVDDEILNKSFENMSHNVHIPEDIKEEFMNILNSELSNRLPEWRKIICDYIYNELQKYLNEMIDICDDNLKNYITKTSDMLSDEIDKIKEWFNITQNQDVKYRIVTLGDMLEQEWDYVKVISKVDESITVNGNFINFLYTIIRELIWNAEKYSGYKEGDDQFEIIIKMEKNEKILHFEVINNIKNDISYNDIDMNIAEIKNIIKSVEKTEATIHDRKDIVEGKSGYKKIVKLLKRTSDENYEINIERIESKFQVKINLTLEEFT